MYSPNHCQACGLPYDHVEWSAEISGIGDDETQWETFTDDEACQCDCEGYDE